MAANVTQSQPWIVETRGLQRKQANHASHTGEVRVWEALPWRITWKRKEGRLLTSTLSLHMHVCECTHSHACQHTWKHVCYIYMKRRKSKKKCTGNEKEKLKEKEGYRKEIQDSKQKKEILIMVILMMTVMMVWCWLIMVVMMTVAAAGNGDDGWWL